MAEGMHFVNTVDNKQAIVSAEELKRAFRQVQQQATDTGTTLDGIMKKLAVATGVTMGAATLKELASQVMNVRGEFQKLEIAFETMLGSSEKANKLMQQLTKTAATTPFDLNGVAQGAKQLLAYGIAADDVNQTLINLGDIAAGLSIPLGDMVMLYGTTMVQGRMFTQDLRQFMGRGIPIMQALADTMGVAKEEVQDLVSTGKVGAQEFQTALMSLVAEGGQFGGLMEKQSKSISGQISNIQDGVMQMFNEIGQKSEGAISLALTGVSKLVENYETVGKAVLAVAGTYGTYKAALVIVSAVEKAHSNMIRAAILEKKLAAAANITLSNSDAMAAARKAFFTKTIKANTRAVLKNTAAMLTNPAVLITAALVALCATVYAVTRALNTQARAQERVNDINEKNKEQLDNTKSEADQAIHTIQSETATVYEKAKAYETLKKIMPELTNQYSQAELATLDLTTAQKAEAAALENLEFDQQRNSIANSKKAIADYEKRIADLNEAMKYAGEGGLGLSIEIARLSTKMETEKKVLSGLEKEYQNMQKLREQALFDAQPAEVKIAYFVAEKEEAERQLEELQKQAEDAAAKAKAEWEQNPLNQGKISVGMTFEQDAGSKVALLGMDYMVLQGRIQAVRKTIADSDTQIANLSTTATNETLPQLIGAIKEAETALETARKNYAADMSESNKKLVEGAEETLKKATEKYKLATNTAWVDSQKMREEQLAAIQKAENEKQRILNSSIQSERAKREAEYWQQIKEINQEEAAYRKAHNGRISGEFKQRRENAELQFTFDTQEFDRRFEEWKKQFENETLQIKIDTRTNELGNSVSMAQTITERIQKQNELYEHQIELIKTKNQEEADKAVSDRYGANTLVDFRAFSANENNAAVLSSYRNAKTKESKREVAKNAGLDEALLATYSEMQQIYEAYSQRLEATIQQAAQGHNIEMFKQDIDDYADYCEEIIEAARWREEQLAAIESGQETNRTKEMVEADYKAMVKKSGAQHDIDDLEANAADIVSRLIGSLADVTYDQIDAAAAAFYEEIDNQIKSLEQAKTDNQAEIQTNEQQKQEAEQQLEQNPLLTEEQRLALTQQIADAEARILALKQTETGLDGQINKLTTTRKQMENSVATAKQTSGKKSVMQMQTEQRATENVVGALQEVSNAAKSVANVMGGVLSKKSKKALGVISEVADFGIQSIQSIQYVATNASTLMESTAVGAAGAIQTVEKASVILTIISIAIQVIMKIIQIAQKFSKSSKMQESIDAYKEKVEQLKKANEKLQRSYKEKVGVEYYQGMLAAAKDYSNVIEENNIALKEANDLLDYQKKHHSADSDKVKEAQQQADELAAAQAQYEQEQREMMEELRNDLLTTDLRSLSQSIAESIIDGFEEGGNAAEKAWDDTIDNMIKAMITKNFSLIIEKQLQPVFDRMNKMVEDDGTLDTNEIEEISNMFSGAKDGILEISKGYKEMMDEMGLLTDKDEESSKGGFQSMSQDTADELNARFTALQIEGANVVTATQEIQSLIANMEANDYQKVNIMQSIQQRFEYAIDAAIQQIDQLRIIATNTEVLNETNLRLKNIQLKVEQL